MYRIMLYCNISHLFELVHPNDDLLKKIAKYNILSFAVLVFPTLLKAALFLFLYGH